MLTAIINGNHDDELEDIADAVNSRRKALSAKRRDLNLVKFSKGDEVRTRNLSPKYINGLTATIVDKKRTRFVVEFADSRNTKQFGTTATVPASCLEAV